MKATLNDLLNAKGVSEPLREAVKVLTDRLEAAEKEVAHIKEVEFPRKVRAVVAGWEKKCARLEQERDALREGLKRMCLDEDAEAKEAKRLKARIEQMEKQEPVAFVKRNLTGQILLVDAQGNGFDLLENLGVSLFTLPGAQDLNLSDPAVQKRLAAQWGYVPAEVQPAPSVPEGFALVNKAHFLAVLDREDWRTAKNRAELRAKLAAAAAAAPEAKP